MAIMSMVEAIRSTLSFLLTVIPLPDTHPEPSPLVGRADAAHSGQWSCFCRWSCWLPSRRREPRICRMRA